MTARAYALFQLFLLTVWLGEEYLLSGVGDAAVAYMYLALCEVIRSGDEAGVFEDDIG